MAAGGGTTTMNKERMSIMNLEPNLQLVVSILKKIPEYRNDKDLQ